MVGSKIGADAIPPAAESSNPAICAFLEVILDIVYLPALATNTRSASPEGPMSSVPTECQQSRSTPPSPRLRIGTISRDCPACATKKVSPNSPANIVVRFANDRLCAECGCRYRPPTPIWAAVITCRGRITFGGVHGLFRDTPVS